MAGKSRVPRRLRVRSARSAGYLCGYCRTPENIAGFRLSIEHIIPEPKGGQTIEGNLSAQPTCGRPLTWLTVLFNTVAAPPTRRLY
jgi:hypothetical protein